MVCGAGSSLLVRRIPTGVSRTVRFTRTLSALTLVTAVGAALTVGTPPPVEAAPVTVSRQVAPPPTPVVLVVGDSITARYNNIRGHQNRGWWSIVGERWNARMVTMAQAGTGVIARGGAASCALGSKNRLTTFGYRTQRGLRTVKADALIVAGGANDWRRCGPVKKGKSKLVNNTDALIRAQMRKYLTTVKTEIRAAGLPASQVLFMTPRGPDRKRDRDRVVVIFAQEVHRAGFKYIDSNIIPASYTVDRTHPNLAGNQWLADLFLWNVQRQAPAFKPRVIARPNWKPRP